jgi:iron(III) transport system substrate-binding protein
MSNGTSRPAFGRLAAAALAAGIAYVPFAASAEGVVNIYSYRQPDLIKPVLDAFTAETGIQTEVLFLDKGLEDRILAEGTNSPADVILTVDIAHLTNAKEKGVTQALDDETVNANLPAEYRDPQDRWIGTNLHLLVVLQNTKSVRPAGR